MKKLYCNVPIGDGTTLVRVDNVKEFNDVFPSNEDFNEYFKQQLRRRTTDPKFTPEPYIIKLTQEGFDKLTKVIKQKLGVSDPVKTTQIKLVFNSHSYSVIRIETI